MWTKGWPCGCRISGSMFGDRHTMFVTPCKYHLGYVQHETNKLGEALTEAIQEHVAPHALARMFNLKEEDDDA